MSKLLIVDDERNVLSVFRKRLASETLQVLTAETASEAVALAAQERPAAMLLDVRLPDRSGLDAFDEIRQLDPRLPVIIMTAHATTDVAIDAMKRGAFEYLLKPIDIQQLREVVARALEVSRLRHVPALLTEQDNAESGDRIVGRSAAMQEVYKAIGRSASEPINVLIQGESGTGKELVARAIYAHSQRHDQMFLAINCAALPENVLESELFGHERGAFTGADRRRIGKFEQAHGGTIFLDELGDMNLATQAKILRLLQDGRFERVGGNETLQTDVRVIAATNQDLDRQIAAGEFRQDLYFRLNGFTINLPPLRERREDLPALIEYFVRVAQGESPPRVVRIAPEALRLLEQYEWPGNVRELQSVVKYALVHAVGEVITPECLPACCHGPSPAPAAEGGLAPAERLAVAQAVRRLLQSEVSDVHRRIQTEVDRIVFEETLHHVQGNQVQASERLGISRTTLRNKLQNWEQRTPPPAS